MAKRSPKPLDRDGFEVRFYEGELERLKEVLPAKISVTFFIRECISKALRRIEERAAQLRVKNEPRDIEIDLPIGTGES
jgi:hypothetical protein